MNSDTIVDGENVIYFDYLDKLFDDKDVEELKQSLKSKGATLIAHVHEPEYIAGIDDFFAQVRVIIDSDVFKAFLSGTSQIIFAEIILKTLNFLYGSLHGKKIPKIRNRKVERVAPNVQFIFGRAKVIIPTDIDEAKFKYFTDMFFEHLPEIDTNNDSVEKFEIASETIVKISIWDYVPESVKEEMKKV